MPELNRLGEENPDPELKAVAGEPNVEEELPNPDPNPGLLPPPKGGLTPNPKDAAVP